MGKIKKDPIIQSLQADTDYKGLLSENLQSTVPASKHRVSSFLSKVYVFAFGLSTGKFNQIFPISSTLAL